MCRGGGKGGVDEAMSRGALIGAVVQCRQSVWR